MAARCLARDVDVRGAAKGRPREARPHPLIEHTRLRPRVHERAQRARGRREDAPVVAARLNRGLEAGPPEGGAEGSKCSRKRLLGSHANLCRDLLTELRPQFAKAVLASPGRKRLDQERDQLLIPTWWKLHRRQLGGDSIGLRRPACARPRPLRPPLVAWDHQTGGGEPLEPSTRDVSMGSVSSSDVIGCHGLPL